ncbi:YhjD/YihY/BrkB family envelope integrity protein [uncultured Thiodictyon sp.]|uniref:YhjD/YihY/BrkB family envelope integrity protein n=1 Tax=uncultured Thiodictyon sp. TaxID=1846217 RepID=UPI0025D36E0C|nr:YhjD/YihY/BrkB family envelope integrity protein [uncultured Thiodictyon sp.]
MNPAARSPWERLDTLIWSSPLAALPRWRWRLVWLARLVYALYRDSTQGNLSLQAMSLVYTTLLSLVPLLAVSFSVLKGFGAHNALQPLLLHALQPLGDQAPEIARNVLAFVDNMRVGVLGSLGLAVLVYTVVSMIQKIEYVFNDTWRVTETRPFAQRVSQYLSVLLIGPVLFFTAVGLSASARNTALVESLLAVEPVGTLIDVGGSLVPFLLIVFAFAFIYIFVPNARVRVRSALIGALVAGVLWQAMGWLFAHFMVSSTQYTAIYSGLAILILFMIWLYIAWLIVLTGASVAFYHQHPEYLASRARDLRLSNRLRERLALLVAGHCARTFLAGEVPWTADRLSAALVIPSANTERILQVLEQDGFLLRTAQEPPRYVPGKAPESVTVKSLLDAVRCFEEGAGGGPGTVPDRGIQVLERQLDEAMAAALGGMTLRDLAAAMDGPHRAVQEDATQATEWPVT